MLHLAPDSREHLRLVRGRSQAGINLFDPEARTLMGKLARGMHLPLPFHSFGSRILPRGTLVLRLQYTGNCCMASYGCTHMLCTSSPSLQKKVALQPYMWMGGPTPPDPHAVEEWDLRVAN